MFPDDRFIDALRDYRYLLDRKYPQKSILQLVGTRHALSRRERSMLYRGIFTSEEAEFRKLKLTGPDSITGKSLHVDGFNVLFSVASYLEGVLLYLADDGLLRDTLEGHGKGISRQIFNRSVVLADEYICRLCPSKTVVYLDRQLEEGFHAESLIMGWCHYTGELEVILDDSPDHLLMKVPSGYIATSDSKLIDRSVIPAADLARAILEHHFHPVFPDLSGYGR